MHGMWGSKESDDLEDVPLASLASPIPRGRPYRAYERVGWMEWVNNSVYESTLKFLISLIVFSCFTGGIVLAFHFGCNYCVLALVGASFCLCLCMPYLNVPLWLGLILLTVLGWKLGYGAFTIKWGGMLDTEKTQ